MEPVPAEAVEPAPVAAPVVVAPVSTEPLVEKGEVSFLKTEPLTAIELFKAILVALMAFSKSFDWFHLSDDQEAMILSQFIALSIALTAFARSRVTPTSRVALTKSDAQIIEATVAKQS